MSSMIISSILITCALDPEEDEERIKLKIDCTVQDKYTHKPVNGTIINLTERQYIIKCFT